MAKYIVETLGKPNYIGKDYVLFEIKRKEFNDYDEVYRQVIALTDLAEAPVKVIDNVDNEVMTYKGYPDW